MPQKFWMVWVHNTPTTEKRHTSFESACVEADKLARQMQNTGRKVYVLEAMDYRWVAQTPLTHETL